MRVCLCVIGHGHDSSYLGLQFVQKVPQRPEAVGLVNHAQVYENSAGA